MSQQKKPKRPQRCKNHATYHGQLLFGTDSDLMSAFSSYLARTRKKLQTNLEITRTFSILCSKREHRWQTKQTNSPYEQCEKAPLVCHHAFTMLRPNQRSGREVGTTSILGPLSSSGLAGGTRSPCNSRKLYDVSSML